MKLYYELNNDPTKTCFEYKIKIKVDHKMKNLKIVQNGDFITYIVIFMEHFLLWVFYVLACAHVLFLLIMVSIHLKCYITNDVHLIICALCEKKQLK